MARGRLIDRSDDAVNGERLWVSPPEQTDESVIDHTGRSWNEWCDIIDGWPEADHGHAAIAARVLNDSEPADVNRWRVFWTDWLGALNGDAVGAAEDDVPRREGTGSADVVRLRA